MRINKRVTKEDVRAKKETSRHHKIIMELKGKERKGMSSCGIELSKLIKKKGGKQKHGKSNCNN